MIISNVIGGLGNQMFQYAFGRARSLELGVSLKLDLADFSDYRLHQGFELARVFSGEFVEASEEEVKSILGWRRFAISRRVLAKQVSSKFRGKKLIVEPFSGYWPGSSQISDDSYLQGYWQSDRYFSRHAEIIRRDFAFAAPLEGENLDNAEQIKKFNSVSVHIRRGDYVTNPKTRAVLQSCQLDYYLAAVDWIRKRVSEPHFFVFSDDIGWADVNLNLQGNIYFIDNNVGGNSYFDMQLMSLCSHHIIANSSFSWWGAWLNPSHKKIVIAPRRWFVDDRDTSSLCPDEWVRL